MTSQIWGSLGPVKQISKSQKVGRFSENHAQLQGFAGVGSFSLIILKKLQYKIKRNVVLQKKKSSKVNQNQ